MSNELHLLSGDVFLTRNANEADNTTPGYWNHMAILYGPYVIESQQNPGYVIESDYYEFWYRYPEIKILRFHTEPERYGNTASLIAKSYVGNRYTERSSKFWFLRPKNYGMNCVDVVRRAYKDTFGLDPRWKIPDDILFDKRFVVIGSKP